MRRGFTLLELLISCALLLAILGILGTTINRAHQIRQEATRRTTLLTQGRAVLDFIADDLQNIISTNLEILTAHPDHDGTSYGATNNAIRFSRAFALTDTTPGGATNALPAQQVIYFVATNDYPEPLQGYALYRQGGTFSNFAGTASVSVGQHAAPDGLDARDYPVTNIVAGFGTTRLPPASAGETIQVPVSSSGSTHIHDWETASTAWVDVVPADEAGLTNRIETTVVFAASFSQITTNIIERPPTNTVVWPEVPALSVSTGNQSMVRQMLADLAWATGAYTNTPDATTFRAIQTARMIETNVLQVVQTNSVTHAITTNAVPAVWTNDLTLAAWTGVWATVQNELPPGTTTPVRVAWATTNLPPLHLGNFWSHVDGTATNRLDALAGDQWDESLHAWQLSVEPVIDLTNLPWRLNYSLTNSFIFPPPGSSNDIPWMPLSLDATAVIEGAGNSAEWSVMNRYWQSAVGTVPLHPAPAQQRSHDVTTVITHAVTATNMVTIIQETVAFAITNRLTALVRAILVGTNRYDYDSGPVRHDGFDIVSDTGTTWVPVVLQNDFEGADVEVHSLWLDARQREGTTFGYEFAGSYALTGIAERREPYITPPRMLLDGIAACYFQPLAFKEESGEPLLEPWFPGDMELPVCIDIYLELIDPAVGRRAASMPENQRDAFVRRQVVRLTKRVPLQTHNRWRAP